MLAFEPWPIPNPSVMAVELDGTADHVELRVYSPAMDLESVVDSGPCVPGWNEIPMPAGWMAKAPNGVYFVRVAAWLDGSVSEPFKPSTFVLLRPSAAP